MCVEIYEIADLASEFEDKWNLVIDHLNCLKREIAENGACCGSNVPSPKEKSTNFDKGPNISTPLAVRGKGHQPSKRKEVPTEKHAKKNAKGKKVCHYSVHYTNCLYASMIFFDFS